MVRIWKRKVQTREAIAQERKAIEEQKVLFELDIALQEEAIEFREAYLKWLDEVVTLDDVLQAMMDNGLCQKISVWKKRIQDEKASGVLETSR